MDVPGFSLDQILTAIEKRVPGGRFTANAVFVVLLVWLLIAAITGIVDGLKPLIDFLWPGGTPQVDTKKATSAIIALIAVVALILSLTAWFATLRRNVGKLGHRVASLSAITTLVALKEEGTALLNEDLTRATPEEFTNWQIRIHLWEEEVATHLTVAGVSAAAISDFRTLVTAQLVGPAINEQHARTKGILAEHLHRLRAIINDLDRSSSQMEKLRRVWPMSS